MTNPLDEYIPDEREFWYYHEPSGLVFMNDPDYGWIAVAESDIIELMLNELEETLGQVQEHGFMDPSDITVEQTLSSYIEESENE